MPTGREIYNSGVRLEFANSPKTGMESDSVQVLDLGSMLSSRELQGNVMMHLRNMARMSCGGLPKKTANMIENRLVGRLKYLVNHQMTGGDEFEVVEDAFRVYQREVVQNPDNYRNGIGDVEAMFGGQYVRYLNGLIGMGQRGTQVQLATIEPRDSVKSDGGGRRNTGSNFGNRRSSEVQTHIKNELNVTERRLQDMIGRAKLSRKDRGKVEKLMEMYRSLYSYMGEDCLLKKTDIAVQVMMLAGDSCVKASVLMGHPDHLNTMTWFSPSDIGPMYSQVETRIKRNHELGKLYKELKSSFRYKTGKSEAIKDMLCFLMQLLSEAQYQQWLDIWSNRGVMYAGPGMMVKDASPFGGGNCK